MSPVLYQLSYRGIQLWMKERYQLLAPRSPEGEVGSYRGIQ